MDHGGEILRRLDGIEKRLDAMDRKIDVRADRLEAGIMTLAQKVAHPTEQAEVKDAMAATKAYR